MIFCRSYKCNLKLRLTKIDYIRPITANCVLQSQVLNYHYSKNLLIYSLLKSKKSLTMLEIEKSFASNICRCTGYRPILEAFKTFASDAPKPNKLLDIEDLNIICNKSGESCIRSKCDTKEWCLISADDINVPKMIEIDLNDGRRWYKVFEVNDIFKVLLTEGDDNYMLVAGNTAKGKLKHLKDDLLFYY